MQQTSHVIVACDRCGTQYRLAADKAGRRIKCKKCNQPFLAQPIPPSRAGAGAREPAGLSPLAAALVAESKIRRCPRCGEKCDPSAVLCVSCGTPLAGGEMIRTQIEKPQQPEPSPHTAEQPAVNAFGSTTKFARIRNMVIGGILLVIALPIVLASRSPTEWGFPGDPVMPVILLIVGLIVSAIGLLLIWIGWRGSTQAADSWEVRGVKLTLGAGILLVGLGVVALDAWGLLNVDENHHAMLGKTIRVAIMGFAMIGIGGKLLNGGLHGTD